MLLITIAMVLVIICGLALFFVYGDSTEPLLPSITDTGVNE